MIILDVKSPEGLFFARVADFLAWRFAPPPPPQCKFCFFCVGTSTPSHRGCICKQKNPNYCSLSLATFVALLATGFAHLFLLCGRKRKSVLSYVAAGFVGRTISFSACAALSLSLSFSLSFSLSSLSYLIPESVLTVSHALLFCFSGTKQWIYLFEYLKYRPIKMHLEGLKIQSYGTELAFIWQSVELWFVKMSMILTTINDQHNVIGCQTLYGEDSDELSVENVYILLNNSWSCDLRLYPTGCPNMILRYGTVVHGWGQCPTGVSQNMLRSKHRCLSSVIVCWHWRSWSLSSCIWSIMKHVPLTRKVGKTKHPRICTLSWRKDSALAFAAVVCAFLAVQCTGWHALVVWWIATKKQLRAQYFNKDGDKDGSWKKKGDR